VTTEKLIAIEISYPDARSLVTFSGVSYCKTGNLLLLFAYDTKEKEHQKTRQSDLYYRPPLAIILLNLFNFCSQI
jgi:hypothetical protein